MSNATQATTEEPSDRFLTKKEVAKLLAMSTRSVDRLCQEDKLEKVYVGSTVRFRWSDVRKIIKNGC